MYTTHVRKFKRKYVGKLKVVENLTFWSNQTYLTVVTQKYYV